MPITVFESTEALGEAVADRLLRIIDANPSAAIGLATGSSPLTAYAAWARRVREAGIDVSAVRGFALDEYLGLDPEDEQSYHTTIHRTVTEPVGLDPERVRVPSGVGDPEREAADFEAAIRAAGGIAAQVLGVGGNGHLGFNEPGADARSRTRVVALAERTVADNARFFGGEVSRVPTRSVTQGLGTILEARELLVIAIGPEKAEAVAAALEGPVTAAVPASILREHPNVHWFLDEAAASQLGGPGGGAARA